MAHPSNSLPTSTYIISASATGADATPASGTVFHSITCSVAGSITVNAGSVYEFVDGATAGDTGATGYIDPNTGEAFAETGHGGYAAGFYQPTGTVSITMVAGQTIYGRFTTVKGDGTFTGFAYT